MIMNNGTVLTGTMEAANRPVLIGHIQRGVDGYAVSVRSSRGSGFATFRKLDASLIQCPLHLMDASGKKELAEVCAVAVALAEKMVLVENEHLVSRYATGEWRRYCAARAHTAYEIELSADCLAFIALPRIVAPSASQREQGGAS